MSDQKSLEPVKEPKLTMKQRKFLDEYFKTGNGTMSALKAYDTKDYATAASIARENLKKLQPSLKTWMEVNGFSLKVLCSVLAQGLQATKIVTSPTEKDREMVDYAVRHKYLETAARWLLEKEEQPTQAQQTNVLVQINSDKEKYQ